VVYIHVTSMIAASARSEQSCNHAIMQSCNHASKLVKETISLFNAIHDKATIEMEQCMIIANQINELGDRLMVQALIQSSASSSNESNDVVNEDEEEDPEGLNSPSMVCFKLSDALCALVGAAHDDDDYQQETESIRTIISSIESKLSRFPLLAFMLHHAKNFVNEVVPLMQVIDASYTSDEKPRSDADARISVIIGQGVAREYIGT
jgi:hypothetical protein